MLGGLFLLALPFFGVHSLVKKQEEDRKNNLMDSYITTHSSMELEEKYEEMVKDPTKYDEIWEYLEKYKADGGDCSDHNTCWKTVGGKRLPFFEHGIPTKKYSGYRNIAVYLLLATHGMTRRRDAIFRASDKIVCK